MQYDSLDSGNWVQWREAILELEAQAYEASRQDRPETLEQITPDIIATGNIGCMVQLASGTQIPVVHTAELLDWATGGPLPPALAGSSLDRRFVSSP